MNISALIGEASNTKEGKCNFSRHSSPFSLALSLYYCYYLVLLKGQYCFS